MFDSATADPSQDSTGGDNHKTNPAITKLKKKETGIGRDVMAQVKHRFKNDPKRQIDEFFKAFPIPSCRFPRTFRFFPKVEMSWEPGLSDDTTSYNSAKLVKNYWHY